ncbi:transmembrane protein 56 [Cricetulus griseus]
MEANTKLVIGIVCSSFVIFQILFHFVSYWFSAKVSPGYNSLSIEKKIEWNSRVVSTCHSLLVGTYGLYLFLFDEPTIADPLWWFFETLKYPKFSKANVINGILMTVVFFVVRIIAIPPLYFFIYSVYGTEAFIRLGFTIQFTWITTCLILDVMNVMWMIKITKGCIKVISLIRQEKAKNSLQNGKLD